MDSLDEAGVGNMSPESVGLALSSDNLFAKKPELTSACLEASGHGRREMSLCLSTAVSIEAVPAVTWLDVF